LRHTFTAGSSGNAQPSSPLPAGALLQFDYRVDSDTSHFDSDSDSAGWADSEQNELPRLLVRIYFSNDPLLLIGITKGYHPSTSLSEYLLAVCEAASVALVPDYVWCSVLKPVRQYIVILDYTDW
jgi:hypothetical protein